MMKERRFKLENNCLVTFKNKKDIRCQSLDFFLIDENGFLCNFKLVKNTSLKFSYDLLRFSLPLVLYYLS